VGSDGEWGCGSREARDSSHDAVSMETASESGSSGISQGESPRVDPRMRELERENQKLKDTVTLLSQELMALKKKMNLV